MKEIWKEMPNERLKEIYEISNYGLVRTKDTKEIIPRNIRSGYLNITRNVNIDGKQRLIATKIHRMVALAFIENDDPVKKKWVNHINGDKYDCRISNLEWISKAGNVQHAIDNGLIKPSKSAVIQYDLKTGKTIKTFNTIVEASDATGISDGHIASVCTGNLKHAKGFGWKFAEENPNRQKNLDLSKFKQIDGFPNYVINKEGKIYSLSHKKFLKYQSHQEGCSMVQLTNVGTRKDYLVHRLVASYFLKRVDKNHNSIRHKDGNKKNNHVNNLEWCHVPGVECPELKYDTIYYDPKTAIKPPKRKLKTEGPKDLLTANKHCLSRHQRAELKKLEAKQKMKETKSGSKTSRPKQKLEKANTG